MKISTSFITNSSSSSFVVYGVRTSNFEIQDTSYMDAFEIDLKRFEKSKKDSPESFEKWHKDEYEEMTSLKTDAERIMFCKKRYEYEERELLECLGLNVGGEEGDIVGMEIPALVSTHPNLKMKDVKKHVAKELSEKLGLELGEDVIRFIEEAWRDG